MSISRVSDEPVFLGTNQTAATALHGGESGVGAGLRGRRAGKRASDPLAERGGRVDAGVPGVGSGHQVRESTRHVRVGEDRRGTRDAAGDSMR
jgi:hypothetical protein